jgi:hypothetical protein
VIRFPGWLYDAAPILGIVGLNGSGKTQLAGNLAAEAFRRGHQVFTNCSIDGAVRITHIDDIVSVAEQGPGLLVLDEIQSVFSARDWSDLGTGLLSTLMQLRKREVRLVMTLPALSQVDVQLRRIVSAVAECHRFGASGWGSCTWFWAAVFTPEESVSERLYLGRVVYRASPLTDSTELVPLLDGGTTCPQCRRHRDRKRVACHCVIA